MPDTGLMTLLTWSRSVFATPSSLLRYDGSTVLMSLSIPPAWPEVTLSAKPPCVARSTADAPLVSRDSACAWLPATRFKPPSDTVTWLLSPCWIVAPVSWARVCASWSRWSSSEFTLRPATEPLWIDWLTFARLADVVFTCATSAPSCVVSLVPSCVSELAAELIVDASIVACWSSTVRVPGSPGLLATESKAAQRFDSCPPMPVELGSPNKVWICCIVAFVWSRLASDPCWKPAWISMNASRNRVTDEMVTPLPSPVDVEKNAGVASPSVIMSGA